MEGRHYEGSRILDRDSGSKGLVLLEGDSATSDKTGRLNSIKERKRTEKRTQQDLEI